MSHVTCHLSLVTCHLSLVTCHMRYLVKSLTYLAWPHYVEVCFVWGLKMTKEIDYSRMRKEQVMIKRSLMLNCFHFYIQSKCFSSSLCRSSWLLEETGRYSLQEVELLLNRSRQTFYQSDFLLEFHLKLCYIYKIFCRHCFHVH